MVTASECRLLLVAVSLLATSLERGTAAAKDTCPTAHKFLKCVTPEYRLPNLTAVIAGSKTPRLSVVGFPGLDLRQILPWNDIISLTRRRTDPSLYRCQLPIFPGKRLLSYASNPRSRYHDMFSTCTRCPLFSQSYYVTGGVRNVNSLTKDDIKALPALQAWKTFYQRIAPNLSMCLAVNPCLMNIQLGIAGLQRGVNIQSQGVAVQMVLHSYFFSFLNSTVPPAWRQSTPRFWMMYDTQAFNNTGFYTSVERLTTPAGRTFVAGPFQRNAAQTVTLPCASLSLNSRSSDTPWLMWRDETKVAVSFGLPAAPNIRLWDQIGLNLWQPGGVQLKDVQLLTRWPSCQFWLSSASGASVRAFSAQVPDIGSILERLYRNIALRGQNVAQVQVYLGGTNGAAVRLNMAIGKYPLTKAAQLRLGQPFLASAHSLVFTAAYESSTFMAGVTVQQGSTNTPVHFCTTVDECPQEYESCDEAGVCLLPNA